MTRFSLLLSAVLISCGGGDAPPTATGPSGVARPAMAEAVAPSAAPAPEIGGAITGTVLETMDSGGYTYARLDTGKDELWVAGPTTPVTVGSQIAALKPMPMPGFKSRTLDRTFDRMYFAGSLQAGGLGQAAAAPPATAGSAMPPGLAKAGGANPHAGLAGLPSVPNGSGAPPAPASVPVPPLPGGQTVAAVFAGAASLTGKPAAVRGRVLKTNAGILNRNWIHLADGTGAPGGDDLLVTTAADVPLPAVGAVVVARGTVATNRDFGAGYAYPVLIEDATVEQDAAP